MEHEIVLGANTPGLDDTFQLVPRMLDRGDVVGVGLERGLLGRARFGHDAKFIAAADVGQRFERREAAHIRVRPARHRGTRTVPRHDDPVRPQARERFAHGRPRRRKAFGQRMLGRQPLTLLVLAFKNAIEDVAVDLVGQARRFALVHQRC